MLPMVLLVISQCFEGTLHLFAMIFSERIAAQGSHNKTKVACSVIYLLSKFNPNVLNLTLRHSKDIH